MLLSLVSTQEFGLVDPIIINCFHTIKSILNLYVVFVLFLLLQGFHTIKSILNFFVSDHLREKKEVFILLSLF